MTSQQVPAAPSVQVEVLLLRSGRDGGVAYRTVRRRLDGDADPDLVAAAACDGDRVRVLHSTSWRHVAGEGVVLTYAALPDPDLAADSSPLVAPAVVSSGDPLRPTPEQLHPHHVAAHAVRHLAELAGRDPAVRTAAEGAWDEAERELWRRVVALAPLVPTGTHEAVHAAARAASGRAGLPRPA
ncbi:hypothetical protein [Aquipuribacter sp. MA13-6]|uniref:hypothetical protein n=1 Tax=unclassified Aquipuribacter TaxID=2635084 RepID=UPI003EEE8C12